MTTTARRLKGRAIVEALSTSSPRRTYVPWGTSAALDLHGCEFAPLADPDCIGAFGAVIASGASAAESSASHGVLWNV